ncbi:glycosyltransferase family 4 protein [Desulfurispora thermophila]|uniref:glycosyltransferase family 4 protein n=1 Tax=Desulfurispora thermophila TaxID=265470 RepID=UPI000368B032|nr:glycosyltransferase family 4 protein [Desulfurispora thermophila]
MRIGIFTDSYKPYTSGVVRSIELFTGELQLAGHEVFIFAPSYPYQQEREPRVYRFASIPAPTNPHYTLALPFSWRLGKKIKHHIKPEIIHVHSPFLLGRLGAYYARVLDVPLVFTFHTLYDEYVHYVPLGQQITREITRRYCRDFCNNCDVVIAPTSIIANHLRNMGVESELAVVPTGINLQEYEQGNRNWLRNTYNIAPTTKVLLSVGRLGQEKNQSFLLRVIQKVWQGGEDVCLVLVGSGPEEQNLRALAGDLGVGERVIFTGTLSREDVVNCYLGADLFVFASLTETQGLVIGEAMAGGLPVVAIKANGVIDMVRDGQDGFLVSPDEDSFAEKVRLMISRHELYRQMAHNALQHAQEMSARACTQKLLECYHLALQKKKDIVC